MVPYVADLRELDPAQVGLYGGKAASLGALSRLTGVNVPGGFCVTTEAFRRAVKARPAVRHHLDLLARSDGEERERRAAICAEIRGMIEGAPLPLDVEQAIRDQLKELGEDGACAVRSSATAEDSPTASFAGQHDTALDVVGPPAVLAQIRRCWASLFSDRAVAYREQQGLDHDQVHMAVVVQRLVVPTWSGVLFTADPLSGDRRSTIVEASPGLGEALVSGHVRPDRFRVRAGQIVARPDRPGLPPLEDEQIQALEALGRRIETHFGRPQDIEWCLAEAGVHVVQARPITTLYPVPDAGAPGFRVFISVGHQQMMTDAIRPLGLSLFQSIAGRAMYAAGGRLFVDPTAQLTNPAIRAAMLEGFGRMDPLIRDALQTVLDRGEIPEIANPGAGPPGGIWARPASAPQEDEAAIIADLIAGSEAALDALKQQIQGREGVELIDLIQEDMARLKQRLGDPRSMGMILAGMNSAAWLNDHLLTWLGEKNAADTLSQSVANNVTSQMGLELLDVADAIREHPEVVDYLQRAPDVGFLEGLRAVKGGERALEALSAWLERYGMRCAGEIDVTRPRWAEAPTTLVPLLLSDVRAFEPGAGKARFEQGRQEAERSEQDLLGRLRALPDGEQKANEARQMIRRLRSTIGFREYPKYTIVRHLFLYKQELLKEAGRLVATGLLSRVEDLWYLTLEELREGLVSRRLDRALIQQRREAHQRFERLSPPRVITSDGEIIVGEYRRTGLPEGALVGLAVSAGVVEGRARVLKDMAEAELEEGDILVTPFTDPSWTPLFVAIKALVTEVGGLTTHGAVIAREYGLPAVIGVVDATRRIRDGDRIRVNGTEGYVQPLVQAPPRAPAR